MTVSERDNVSIEDPMTEREWAEYGAECYREEEQQYFAAVFDGLYADEDDDFTEEERVSEKYTQAVLASLSFHEMKELERLYGLLIGGKDGKYQYGNKFPYDPDVHMFVDDPEDPPPFPGETVIVFMSEIATKDGETILPAAFSNMTKGPDIFGHEQRVCYSSKIPQEVTSDSPKI